MIKNSNLKGLKLLENGKIAMKVSTLLKLLDIYEIS